MHLGRWKIKSPKYKQIKWAKYHVKALGAIHEHNVNIDALWRETNHQNNIPNKLWNRSEENTRKVQKKLMWALILGRKRKSNKKICLLFASWEGGMGMIYIDSLIKANQLQSMHKILWAKKYDWDSIGKWWLKKNNKIYNNEYFCLHALI